jgi:hypothetical protein
VATLSDAFALCHRVSIIDMLRPIAKGDRGSKFQTSFNPPQTLLCGGRLTKIEAESRLFFLN